MIEVPDGDGLVLGRAGNETLRLDDEAFPQVLSFHARLSWDSGTLYVEDLDSKNGTQVNGKKVRRSPLQSGDVILLGGRKGPKFLVVGPAGIQETISAGGGTAVHSEGDSVLGRPGRSLSATSIFRIKSALGIPHEEEGVKQMVHSRVRTLFTFTVLTILVVLGVAWIFLSDLWQENRQLNENLQQLRQLLDLTDVELQAQRDAAVELKRALESEKERLKQMRESLMAKLTGLETDEQASSDEIRLVQAELQQTRLKLEQYDPVRLEEEERSSRRVRLEAVLKAVVFVEKKVVYRHRKSGKLIHLDTDEYGNVLINWEDRGELLSREGGGSGFCVSEDGWIVTNAHVVEEPEMDDVRTPSAVSGDKASGDDSQDFAVDPVVELEVVFSGSSLRHPARVVKMVREGDEDLALLKVEKFAGLSGVPIFDPDFHGPEAGSEVWIFGFPLGKSIPQEGELLTASVFRGIVSRKVHPYLQVQAVVYPGNSGGPAVDEVGRVIGIVTAVQTTPDGQIASDIGYVIPVEAARKIWPPENP